MTAIKPLNQIADKWAKNSAQSSDEYRQGVLNPRKDWATETVNAKENWEAGLADAISRDAFADGVQEAGTPKWKARASSVGPGRYRQGVGVAKPEFTSGFSRFHSVIAGLTLPPRGPKGSPENLDRVRVLAEALHNERVGG